MSAGNNFVDLRMSNAGIAGDSEDSIWPTFTDIMTVVLMIFLMALVAYLIRNAQLLDELQTTLIEKDQISQQALFSAEQNKTLQAQLAMVREQIVSLESSLQRVTGTRDELQQTLEQKELAVRNLETEIALLTRLRDQLSDSNNDLIKELDIKLIALANTQQTLEDTSQTLSRTEQTLADTEVSLADTKKMLANTELTLAETETEFTESKNTLNEKISMLLAAKAGLLVAKEKDRQALSDSEQARLDLNRQVLSLSEQLRLITDKLDTQTSRNETLDTQLEDQQTIMAGLSASKEELEAKLQEMVANLSALQKLYDQRGLVVNDLRMQVAGNQKQYKSLQEEYDSLDQEYRKLIRPARSPAGKYVVNVYFAKQDGQAVYRISEPEQAEPDTVKLEELYARLGELKERHHQKLYTRIRIDDKSGIGFNEAWRFTQKILADYDYYSHDYSELTPEAVEGQ